LLAIACLYAAKRWPQLLQDWKHPYLRILIVLVRLKSIPQILLSLPHYLFILTGEEDIVGLTFTEEDKVNLTIIILIIVILVIINISVIYGGSKRNN
jgi:hypothetical protein